MLAWSGGDSGRCWWRARILSSAFGDPTRMLFSQERVKVSTPWSKLPLTSGPVLIPPQWPQHPKPEHSLMLSKTLQAVREVAAPAVADGAGSDPCLGQPSRDPPRCYGPACQRCPCFQPQGKEQSSLPPACSSERA